MPSTIEIVLRVLASFSSLAMALSPSPSIYRIHKQKSCGDVQVLPLFSFWGSCHMLMLYGYLSEAIFPMFTTFLAGDVLALVYLAVYCRYTTERCHVAKLTACVLLWNVVMTLVSFSGDGYMGITDLSRSNTSDIVGYIADVVSLILYASPFASLGRVIKTKSAVTIPIVMVVVGSVNNSLWLIYGFTISDMIIVVPNVISVLFGATQMIVYAIYNPKKNLDDQLSGAEFETNGHDLKQKSQVTSQEQEGYTEQPLTPSTGFQSVHSPWFTQA